MSNISALKEQLALACRILANERLFDQSGHISARHPDGDRLLIHPHGTSRYEVQPRHLLVVDFDGNVVEGDDRAPSEVFIHTQVYRARPDIQSVCHTHSRMATVLSIAGRDIMPVTNYAAFLGPGPVPTYPDPRLVRTGAQGDALARALGNKLACVMRNHGAAVVGTDVRDTLVASVYFEENAIRQHLALQVGEPIGYTDEEIADVKAQNWNEGPKQKVWDYYVSRARMAGLA
jgi:ribulose-5-phosphate 4-epimerase/fuculose-1-phosphate aldolase